jgi:polyvinyl alcohol dehydrogenase (cytochrome)
MHTSIPERPRPTKKNSVGTAYGPAGAAVWSALTIDTKRNAVYVATGDACARRAADTSDAVMASRSAIGHSALDASVHAERRVSRRARGGARQPSRRHAPTSIFGNSPILRTLPNGKAVIVIGQKSGAAWGIDPTRRALALGAQGRRGSALGGIEWGSAGRRSRTATLPRRISTRREGGLAALNLATGEQVRTRRHPPAIIRVPPARSRSPPPSP